MKASQWTVGDFTVTSIVEEEYRRVPPEMLFPSATADDVKRHGWLVPDFADEKGRLILRIQAFVLSGNGRRILVDPCVGNGKRRALPYWNEQTFPFLERFVEAGFSAEGIDTVVHTHLHADHVGWDTRLEGGRWVPTFPRARHLYTARELAWCKLGDNPGTAGVYEDSVAPILAAGLADVVPEDADLGGGLRLEPTTGHTPGHVSLYIESRGERAVITGDAIHHPVQCAEIHLAENGDQEPELARAMRRRLLERAADDKTLFVGTHFPTRPAGRVERSGAAFRFVPVEGRER